MMHERENLPIVEIHFPTDFQSDDLKTFRSHFSDELPSYRMRDIDTLSSSSILFGTRSRSCHDRDTELPMTICCTLNST